SRQARTPEGFGGARRVRRSRPGGVGLDDPAVTTDGEPKGASALLVVVLPFFCRQQLLNSISIRSRSRSRTSYS
ncbi:hypothetical protein AGJ10_21555, partial [Cronobacter sakazakii]|nr:hypothetical protein [Cronobacter sakazakii]